MKERNIIDTDITLNFGTLSTFGMKELEFFYLFGRTYFGTLSTFGMKEPYVFQYC